jgi:hypothetical protein
MGRRGGAREIHHELRRPGVVEPFDMRERAPGMEPERVPDRGGMAAAAHAVNVSGVPDVGGLAARTHA